ncbi:MmcQ/YjbR family DNA-binding protein [Enterococcus sp. AZ196]|uniref:MmcQ/YjbR family DNA-binding protein n=1 Tax=Enterococcus sp. AZ196 TaxID=2774659 RepID=UPI003D265BD7
MITKTEIMKYIEEKYNSLPEYIFEKFPNYCVFRHTRGKKWFCLIMTVPQNKLYGENNEMIEIIDVKIDPVLGDIIRNSPFIYPAYHMNKEHWITIDLSQVDHFEQIAGLIEDSYQLTVK